MRTRLYNRIRSFCTGFFRHRLLVVSFLFLLLTLSASALEKPGNHRSTALPPEKKGLRDNTPFIRVPLQDGTRTEGAGEAELDLSHMEDGYFSIRWLGEPMKVKVRVTPQNSKGINYDYNLATDGSWNVFPFSLGDGTYKIFIGKNIEGTAYAEVYSTILDVRLEDKFGPFLYPNQYVWFDDSTRSVEVAKEVCSPADSDLDAVTYVYSFVVGHVVYDKEEAENVQKGYLPEVDEVLDTGKGICFDFSALMASMLRTQRIPTRLVIGHAGTAYHAWISCYVDDIGWIDGLIQFDGENWSLMDPTLASTKGEKSLGRFVGNGSLYKEENYY